jgi:hypothetical protein
VLIVLDFRLLAAWNSMPNIIVDPASVEVRNFPQYPDVPPSVVGKSDALKLENIDFEYNSRWTSPCVGANVVLHHSNELQLILQAHVQCMGSLWADTIHIVVASHPSCSGNCSLYKAVPTLKVSKPSCGRLSIFRKFNHTRIMPNALL